MDRIALVFIAFMLVICCLGHHFAQKDTIKNSQNQALLDSSSPTSYLGNGGEFKKGGAGGSW